MTPALRQVLFGKAPPGAVSPATFVAFNAVHSTTAGSGFNVTIPGSPQTGDIVFVSLTEGTGSNSATVTGAGSVAYTRLAGSNVGGSFLGLFWHVLTSPTDASTAISVNTADANNTIGVSVFRPTVTPIPALLNSAQTTTAITVPTGTVSASGPSGGIYYFSIEILDVVTPIALTGTPTTLDLGVPIGIRPWSSIQYVGFRLAGYPASTANTIGGYNTAADKKILWTVTL